MLSSIFNISLLRPFFHFFVQEGEDKKFLITRLQSIHEQKRDPKQKERSQVCVHLPQREKTGSGKAQTAPMLSAHTDWVSGEDCSPTAGSQVQLLWAVPVLQWSDSVV